MGEYVVKFAVQSYWIGHAIHSSDGRFTLSKSSPDKSTLDRAEVTVHANCWQDASPIAERAAMYYLSIACYENDCYAHLLDELELRGPDRYQSSCTEQLCIVGELRHDTLQETHVYEPVKDALGFYRDGLATQFAVPDYAYLSFFKAIEVLSGGKEKGRPMHEHISDALDGWKIPINDDDVEHICDRRSKVAHGITWRRARRLTPSAEEIAAVRDLARQCIEANLG